MGKGTIVNRLLDRDNRLWLSRSWTTRPRRPSEPADAYLFVDRETFESAAAAGKFLEWVEFLDYLQGTPMPDPPEGSDVVLEIDVPGGVQVKSQVPHAVLIFVDVPSPEHQRSRLLSRGESPESASLRVQKAASERAQARTEGYTSVINDKLETAVTAISELIESDRASRANP